MRRGSCGGSSSSSPSSSSAVVGVHDDEFKERLIRAVKKEVKQIMEEAVTRKFVHQDSSSVTSLCAAVECCLSHGLRRRALGLFRSSSTTALLHKMAKTYKPAEVVSRLILEADAADVFRRSSSSGDSTTRMTTTTTTTTAAVPAPTPPASHSVPAPLQKRNSASLIGGGGRAAPALKYLWIRLALFERILAGIIEHLVDNHNKYYEKDALVAHPEYGSVLSHLLVGPCALEYTRMKTQDHYWTDPPADELVQRHRISSGAYGSASSAASSPANRRPALQYRKVIGSGDGNDGGQGCTGSGPPHGGAGGGGAGGGNAVRLVHSSPAIDYVESLHQNNKVVLLYGKNNVLVLPRDLTEPLAGYLSLHQTGFNLTLKWTPNQLMNGAIDSDGSDKSAYWDYALHVNLHDIVYVHCHQQGSDAGGSMVLVGQDGVQRPAIHFPAGGHLLAFLTCLETAVQPDGRLDPPLWSQSGKGKVFPRIKRKGVAPARKTDNGNNASGGGGGGGGGGGCASGEDLSHDYVFRIVVGKGPNDNAGTAAAAMAADLYEESPGAGSSGGARLPRWWLGGRGSTGRGPLRSTDSTTSSTSSSKSLSASLSLGGGDQPEATPRVDSPSQKGESLLVLCETMKRQIISRAFYGWLAHCRHLRTVRTHLSGLVNAVIVPRHTPQDASAGVNNESWARLMVDGVLTDSFELYRLTYYGGVAHHLRKEVWPYLLGHYPFGGTSEERETQDRAVRSAYETTMSEWLAVEAIIRQRDKEMTAASIAKLSTGHGHNDPATAAAAAATAAAASAAATKASASSRHPSVNDALPRQERSLSNDVFDDFSDDDDDDDVDVDVDVDVVEVDDDEDDEDSELRVDESPQAATVTVVTTHASSGSEEDAKLVQVGGGGGVVEEAGAVHVQLGVDDAQVDRCSAGSRSSCLSPTSSAGGVYSMQLLETFGLNLHRIDKDVQRCDRNYAFFTPQNLDKLRNVMCTYVWCHLDTGYMQGMCDLVAPLLVVIDDEALTYSCFCELMKRMAANFPQGGQMDHHLADMRSLIQILDAELFDLMHQNGDYTHFYFCYRWFLLDFKRELVYDDVFMVWETIWAAPSVASSHLVLFVALALVQYYRDIILSNAMDFTDIIKFFNEMAERHDARAVLRMARELVLQLQTLIDDK